MTDRVLRWDGCDNVRDLGGLGPVARGALIRADGLEKLTENGWAAAYAHGVRTVIDLRNEDEYGPDAAPRPAEITTVRLPLDGIEDREFWDKWWGGWEFGTPVYYVPFLERFPERVAGIVSAVAQAEPGGVVYHCSAGRDRTGLMSLVLLSLLGVDGEEAAADYALSALTPSGAVQEEVIRHLAARGFTLHTAALEVLQWLDAERYVRTAGVTVADLAALRSRVA